MVSVRVKWKAQKFEVPVDSEAGIEAFKQSLNALTNVPVEKMKIMARGRRLKDDASVAALKDGQQLMMIGTASALQQAPTEPVVFREDMTAEQQLEAGAVLPAGLRNLGNTCYLNSTVQCLRGVPELKEGLVARAESSPSDLAGTLGKTLHQMDTSGDDVVVPINLVQKLQQHVPRFGETQQGVPMQQDAEECLTEMLQHVSQVTQQHGTDLVQKVFGGRMTRTTRPADESLVEVEAAETTEVPFSKLRCHIDQSVNHLSTGLKMALSDEVEKRSAVTGNNTVYRRESRISALPQHLLVQFVRFCWRRDIGKKTKVLRRVKFPSVLDVCDLCDESLQSKVRAYRRAQAELEDATREAAQAMADEEHPTKEQAEAALKALVESGNAETGTYELHGVLTHKGESANSGHYIGWSKSSTGQWHKFDDHKVTPVDEDEIHKLAGGGQWDMAYMLFYSKVQPSAALDK
ncbi:MAG: hypothetical protein MHM6MM_007609 [Cercozoa sp. M6MM]